MLEFPLQAPTPVHVRPVGDDCVVVDDDVVFDGVVVKATVELVKAGVEVSEE